MIEPVAHAPEVVDELLDDHEDDPPPVDSAPARWVLTCCDDGDAPTRAGIWSCY